MNNQFESTYALLVRSEEKGRGVLEILVYAVFILGVILSIWPACSLVLLGQVSMLQPDHAPITLRSSDARPHATSNKSIYSARVISGAGGRYRKDPSTPRLAACSRPLRLQPPYSRARDPQSRPSRPDRSSHRSEMAGL